MNLKATLIKNMVFRLLIKPIVFVDVDDAVSIMNRR